MQTSDDKGAKPDPLLGEDDGTARESNVTEAVNGDAAVESEAKPEQHDQVDLLRGRRAEPEDVPTDDLSPSPFASPAPAGPEELPPVASRHEEGSHPDVPDDEAMSIGGESAAHIPNEGTGERVSRSPPTAFVPPDPCILQTSGNDSLCAMPTMWARINLTGT